MRKQPLNRYYNVQKWVPNAGGGSGNDWLRVKNTLGIQIVGIHITDLSLGKPVTYHQIQVMGGKGIVKCDTFRHSL